MDQKTKVPTTHAHLLSPIKLGDLELRHRVVMAPLTRNRAGEGFVPRDMNVEYYRQRASAALIVTEATQISRDGLGYPDTPGIYSDEQVAGWRRVTDAVHAEGGRIFLQLWHVGRISHPSLQAEGQLPIAPSAVRPEGQAMTYEGMQDFVTPRALDVDELPGIRAQYRKAAENAKSAGFDGVEVHNANGYLLDQFLRDGPNQRDDEFGGSIENRMRFPLQVLESVLEVWPSNRVGIRLSPSGTMNDMRDSDPKATFTAMAKALNAYDLAYLHVIEGMESDIRHGADPIPASYFKTVYNGQLMVNGEYDGGTGEAAIAAGEADLVAYGRSFIANPDLPERLRIGADLNEPDPKSFYGGDEKGYTDYPFMDTQAG